MINTIYNDPNYELLPKQRDLFERYCKIIQWGRREPVRFIEEFIGLQLTDYQKWLLCNMWTCRNGIILCSRNTGKATSLDTKVWLKHSDRGENPLTTTVGELKVGDKIYDADGNLSEVMHLNPIIFDSYYEVEFEDGEIIKCNGEHLWLVHDRDFHKVGQTNNDFRLLNTDYIYHNFMRSKNYTRASHDYTFHVPLNKPIKYAKTPSLPIDPYILGYYLGDGCTTSGVITCSLNDIEESVKNLTPASKTIRWRKDKYKENVGAILIDFEKDLLNLGYNKTNAKQASFKKRLERCEDLLHNKHIPERYLYSCVEDRLALLQGLMDTDGYIDKKNGACEFTQSNEQFALDVCQLVRSLGMMCTLTHKEHTGYIKKDGTEADTWRVYFTASKELPVFRMQRKYNLLPDHPKRGGDRKAIIDVRKIEEKIPMRCITMRNDNGLFLCGNNYTVTHNSFLTAPYLAARAMLFPNCDFYIIANTAAQSAETMGKLEALASGTLGSAIGLTSVFIDNCMTANSKTPAFVHSKDGTHVELFNGSTITSLSGNNPSSIRGKRSAGTFFDEAAFIPKETFDAALPFAAQSRDFMTGKGINFELLPKQLPNQNILLSSASDIESEMYAQYKEGFKQMLMGNPDWFVADMDYHISIAPFMNGKPMPPLVSPEVIEAAYKTDIFRAEREFGNIWAGETGPDALVTRATLEKISVPMYPIFQGEPDKKYIIAFDPSAKVDSAVIGVGELFRDEERGLMLKIINVRNLMEVLSNGEKAVIQRPEQIDILKHMIVDYNNGTANYENIDKIICDSGGGGFEIGQFLMTPWKGYDNREYMGLIDSQDPYMTLRADDYPDNIDKLFLFNFKKEKSSGYEHCQQMLQQGLVVMPANLNARNEIEFIDETPEGEPTIRYEKPGYEELDVLLQVGICKSELTNMQKQKKPNGTIVYDLSPTAKSKNGHDDHADVIMMLCDRLYKLREAEALDKEAMPSNLNQMFHKNGIRRTPHNPFDTKAPNPFAGGVNPFI